MDTSALDVLLAAGEWRAADEETRRLLLAEADQGGYIGLDPGEVPKLNCDLLLAVDKAWLTASEGRYGFTPQSEILAAVRADGIGPKATWRAFGARTGWVLDRGWVDQAALSYVADAPRGHLPWVPGMLPTVLPGRTYEVFSLFYGFFNDCAAERTT